MTEPKFQMGQMVYGINAYTHWSPPRCAYGEIINRIYGEARNDWKYVIKMIRNEKNTSFKEDEVFSTLGEFAAEMDRILKTPKPEETDDA